METTILTPKQMIAWIKKHPMALRADDYKRKIKGFVDIETNEIVGCNLDRWLKSKKLLAMTGEDEFTKRVKKIVYEVLSRRPATPACYCIKD